MTKASLWKWWNNRCRNNWKKWRNVRMYKYGVIDGNGHSGWYDAPYFDVYRPSSFCKIRLYHNWYGIYNEELYINRMFLQFYPNHSS